MTSRLVRVGKTQQIITTSFTPDPEGKDDIREHVTLATPDRMTDTARLRLLRVNDSGRRWP
jgi:hypothetical protein